MHFVRAAWPLMPSEKAIIDTAPRAKTRCCCSGCFRNSLIGMAWDDCGIRIIARKNKTGRRCMGFPCSCSRDYRADAPCPVSLLLFSIPARAVGAVEIEQEFWADAKAAREGDGGFLIQNQIGIGGENSEIEDEGVPFGRSDTSGQVGRGPASCFQLCPDELAKGCRRDAEGFGHPCPHRLPVFPGLLHCLVS